MARMDGSGKVPMDKYIHRRYVVCMQTWTDDQFDAAMDRSYREPEAEQDLDGYDPDAEGDARRNGDYDDRDAE